MTTTTAPRFPLMPNGLQCLPLTSSRFDPKVGWNLAVRLEAAWKAGDPPPLSDEEVGLLLTGLDYIEFGTTFRHIFRALYPEGVNRRVSGGCNHWSKWVLAYAKSPMNPLQLDPDIRRRFWMNQQEAKALIESLNLPPWYEQPEVWGPRFIGPVRVGFVQVDRALVAAGLMPIEDAKYHDIYES